MFKNQKYLFSIFLILATTFFEVKAVAQQNAVLDFGNFSGVIDTEDLSLLDYIKLSGMTIVNAPALQNLVGLYGYSDSQIRQLADQDGCRDQALANINVLVIDKRTKAEVFVSQFAPIIEINFPEKWKSFMGSIDGSEWITDAMITETFSENDLGFALEDLGWTDVWKEIQVSGPCDLAGQLPDLLESSQVGWHQVIEHKLQNIIEELEDQQPSELFFLVDHQFPDKDPIKKYLAECSSVESNQPQPNSRSLCAVNNSRL
ncbi:MAG: hypothetical protein OXE94_11910 [Aestuariivita sp.]|nr:hypothetical protein [Aestuariivita sp.]MCY4203141.1 hypothetical protein [Aestuariivita sp.]MCY4345498.1 hypothetical protein [Aestuariivita sp.]